MTDYGRGPSPQPWHPDDPLFGEAAWDPYQQPYTEHGGPTPQGWEGNPYEPYQPQQQQYQEYQEYQEYQGYQRSAEYAGYAEQQAYPEYPEYQAYPGGWEAAPTAPAAPPEPYGAHPAEPCADAPAPVGVMPRPRQPAVDETAVWEPFAEEFPAEDAIAADDTLIPDDPSSLDALAAPDGPDGPDGPDESSDYPAEEEELEEYGSARRDRQGRRRTGKRRGGCVVMAAVQAVAAGLSGGGYEGYRYYENYVVAPPDFVGDGTGSVQVTVPPGATVAQIGNILKNAGVVESVEAFTRAAAGTSQPSGSYTLRLHMSAAAAIALMASPSSRDGVTFPEGWRATKVYTALDKYLGLRPGTTQAAEKTASLGLPSYANGNPEGFLYPSRYSIGKGTSPAAVLARMVQLAETEYADDDLQAGAARMDRTPYEIIIIASLIQAEAQRPQDFGKVSRVIYNRLRVGMHLGFDSTINYAMGRSTLYTSVADTHYPSPYNTYLHLGLPPAPIGNPGHEAIEAALNPTPGDWLYFVTVKPGDTRFTDSQAVQDANVQAFNQYQYQHQQEHGGS